MHTYINRKNGKRYVVLAEGIDCTNARDGTPVIEDGMELIEGAAGSDLDAPTVEAEPVKPQARKPAAK